MDRYDSLILEIIYNHQTSQPKNDLIDLRSLEKLFFERISSDQRFLPGQCHVGAKITNLYVDGLIENKSGYKLTRKGKNELQIAVL